MRSKSIHIIESIVRRILKEEEYDYRGSHRAPGKEDGAPLYDLTLNDIYPDDVYSRRAIDYYGTGLNDRMTYGIILKYKNKPNATVTIYRAVPAEVTSINRGDWVAITKQYAKDHAEGEENWKILSLKVKAKDIYTNGDSWDEWGYDPS